MGVGIAPADRTLDAREVPRMRCCQGLKHF